MDHAAQRPLRLHRPDSIRVALGAVLIVPQYVSETRLVPGHVLPPGIEVVLVAVGDHDPGELRQDPGVLHRVQAAGTQPERRVQLGERAVDVLLLPGRPGPQRGLVEAGHGRCGDQGADQRHHVRGQGRSPRQARMDEPLRHDGAGHVGDQPPAPLHRDMLEDHQVNRQRAQARPDGQGGVRHACRARRDMHPAAGALRLMQVVLHPLRRRGRDLLLLKRPRDAKVLRVRQVTAARAGTLWVMVLGPVRNLPPHRRARTARLLPPPLVLRPLRSAPLLPGRLPSRQVIRPRRHRGIPAVPRPRPPRRRQLLPQVSDHRLQRRDPLRLLPDQRITRIPGRPLRRRIGHSPQSSPNPRTATTATPHTPPRRNHRSLTAASSAGA
jgi:hypothetical protein